MENYEYSGKTVEDAITRACVELGVTSDEITYDVVEKGSKGLFNLGSKDAVIRLTSLKGEPCGEPAPAPEAPEAPAAPEAAPAPEAPVAAEAPEAPEAPEAKEPEEAHEEHHHHEPTGPSDPAVVGIAEAFLKDVFDAMKLEVTMNSTLDAENNVLSIDLSGPEMGIIIGKRGQTLDSLQYITSLAVTKLDVTAKGGVVVGVSDQFHIPVKFIGVGEGIDDLKVFDKQEFVEQLFAPEDLK